MALWQSEVDVFYQPRKPVDRSVGDAEGFVRRHPITHGLTPNVGRRADNPVVSRGARVTGLPRGSLVRPLGEAPVAAPGFTLVELLIVLAITGILAAVAIPSYGHHVRASVMREATLSLLGLVLLQEHLRLSRGQYGDATALGRLKPLPKRVADQYQLLVELGTSVPGFKLVLLPRKQGSGYEKLSVDSRGRRMPLHVWP